MAYAIRPQVLLKVRRPLTCNMYPSTKRNDDLLRSSRKPDGSQVDINITRAVTIINVNALDILDSFEVANALLLVVVNGNIKRARYAYGGILPRPKPRRGTGA